ncbi:MAG TPA: hypothetical protein VFS16_03750 [Acidimicrobiia bacterium]|nr:hypothetical protein [Acidimicrobiia bacterium]
MKKFRPALISIVVVTNAFVGVAAVAQTAGKGVPAVTRCSAASLTGDYALAGQGFLGRVPLAFVGVLHFDGAGRFSGHHEENLGGNYGPATEAGDYSVDDDCMGVIHFTDHPAHNGLPPHNHTIALVVSNGGDDVSILGIDNSPPGQTHREIPEPDIEFWGTLKRL